MSANVEVIASGAWASVQDRGRRGWRRIGVPWAGALDPALLRIANALAGNDENAPAIEAFDGGLQLAARGGALRLAVAGDAVLEVEDAHGQRRPHPPWRSLTLHADEVLRVRTLRSGRIAMIAIHGLALPAVMGSCATYARAALGGVDGRALAAGDRLPATPADGPERCLPDPPAIAGDAVRVVPGPQATHFTDAALACLLNSAYRVSAQADRMGVRLDGPPLAHRDAREIVSDATVPGSIQVPGNGLPIVLLADAQTAGGYPKIATVIGADLARVAQCRPGETLRFAAVDVPTAEAAARAAEATTRSLLASIRPLAEAGADHAALYHANLIGGVVHALDPEYRPL